jgi:cystathionine beta-lyase
MTFDFDHIIDRRCTDCTKWTRYGPDVLPAWIADMDFAAPEPILQALRERIDHGVFGYENPSLSLKETVVAWLARRHAWKVAPDDIVFLPGLVSGLNLVCRAYGYTGDRAAMLTPVYSPFLSAPVHQGLAADAVQLQSSLREGRLHYEIDFDALAAAITPRTRLFLLCHPHNPIGREFTVAEMERLAALCLERDVLICADEIHCDLMLDNCRHTPFATLGPEVADHTVTLMAPSKTFNIPGLGCSFAVVSNPRLRARLEQAAAGIVPHVNVLGLAAAQAAFSRCDEWLAALQAYLTANRDALLAFIDQRLPGVVATAPTATFLAWLDFRQAGLPTNPHSFFLERARVALNDGPSFGPGGGGCVRFNFGCPRSTMMQALAQMSEALAELA